MSTRNYKAAAASSQVDLERLPAFDGGDHYLQIIVFENAPKTGERYYFDQDSRIDAVICTGLRVHYTDLGVLVGGDYDMYRTYKIGAINYNVIEYSDYKNLLLTLSDNKNTMKIQRMPASTFIVNAQAPGFNIGAAPKARKALRMQLSTMRCFIEFTAPVTVRAPFIVPISIYY